MRTTQSRSRLMASVKHSSTSLEIEARSLFRSLGHRFSTTGRGLPGTPDIVNRSRRWAIFVHGCFWHAHHGCSLWRLPSTNTDFWRVKFEQNRARDVKKTRQLRSLRYKVLILWQCELANRQLATAKIRRFMRRAATGPKSP